MKNTSNSFSTGGGGQSFEYRVQAMFLLTLLIDGFSPILDTKVNRICFQAHRKSASGGVNTDDILVEAGNDSFKRRLLCQIKRDITISCNDKEFREVMTAAWNDFNSLSFNKKHDRIVLITGLIAKDSINAIRLLHEKAIHMDTAEAFFVDIEETKHVGQYVRNKKDVIISCLKAANNDEEISKETIWEFFKSFILLVFDVDYQTSVNMMLTTTLISLKANHSATDVWARLVDYAARCDLAGANKTIDNFDENLLEIFKVNEGKIGEVNAPFISDEFFSKLVIIGSWNENNPNDRNTVQTIMDEPYQVVEKKLQKLIVEKTPFVSLEEGIWKIKNRHQIFEGSVAYYFDNFLEVVFNEALNTYSQDSQKFNEKGEYSILVSSTSSYRNSSTLRNAFLKGVCMLANSNKLVNCTKNKLNNLEYKLMKGLFENCSWIRWASLDESLRFVAEISPKYFLDFLEKEIVHNSTEIIKLFPDKNFSFMKPNFICGMLWALESMAWGEETIIGSIRCLCELEMIKPHDYNSGNSPMESLASILLPWHRQTLAGIEKCKNAVKIAVTEYPKIGWKLIKELMPGGRKSTTGTSEPKYYINVPEDFHTTNAEMYEIYDYLLALALEVAGDNAEKLSQLVTYFLQMNDKSVLLYLSSIEEHNDGWNDDEKFLVWLKLSDIKYHLASYKKDELKEIGYYEKLCAVTDKITPEGFYIKNKRLFLSSFDEFNIKEDGVASYDSRYKEKQKIVNEIYIQYGVAKTKEFGVDVENTQFVWTTLGEVITGKDLHELIKKVSVDKIDLEFLQNVLRGFLWKHGSRAVFGLGLENYEKDYISCLLVKIDLSNDLIEAVEKYLGDDECLYWENAIMPYGYRENENFDSKYLVEKLMKHNRHATVVNLYGRSANPIKLDSDLLFDILDKAARNDCIDKLDKYAATRIIEALQNYPQIDKEKLSEIEFLYLPWLGEDSSVSPKALKYKIANNPEFFCQMIELFYKKRNDETSKEPINKELGDRLFAILYKFDVVPGTDWESKFDSEACIKWIEYSLNWGKSNDRDEVLQQTIGNGLSYAQKTSDGLIDETLMQILDKKENEHIRRGYRTGTYNQRGVHWVDPEGKAEKTLYEQFSSMANKVEEKGYSRFAKILIDIANGYLQEAEENKKERRLMETIEE